MNKLITKLNKWLGVAIFCILSFSFANAQVTGTVTDENGEGLPGATVRVLNGTAGAITGVDGEYSVDAGEQEVLVVSYVGYETQEVAVDGQSAINIQLGIDAGAIENVVVVGYGVQNREEITSAVTSIKPEDFNKGNISNPAELIQGKVAGVSISRPGGDPNGGFSIRLRGLTSFGGSTEPLILVDGVTANALDEVDPNDIASIDILKDGSAAAIYGTRGSSGVILITTKKGKDGTSKITYNGFGTFTDLAKTVDVATADEYRSVPAGADLGGSTDWLDEVSRKGFSHVHGLNISGGTNKTSYRAGLNFRDVQGTLKESGFDRTNFRANVSHSALDDKLELMFDGVVTRKNADYSFVEAYRYATIQNPTQPVLDPADNTFDGYYEAGGFDYFNPLAILEQNVNEGFDNIYRASGKISYELIDGLELASVYSISTRNALNGQYYSKNAAFRGYRGPTELGGQASRQEDASRRQLSETTLSYDTDAVESRLGINLLGGYTFEQTDFDGFQVSAGNFVSDDFTYNNLGAATDFQDGKATSFSYKTRPILKGYFGRANFNLDDTYFLSASGRYEGSSLFGEDERFGFFPAVSAGVNLTNLLDTELFDYLKFRAGFGVTGNLPPGNEQLYIGLYQPSGNVSSGIPGSYLPTLALNRDPNPGLKWEQKNEINVGLDFDMLDNRLFGSLDFYNRDIDDLILFVPNPSADAVTGNWFDNVGSTSSTGLELALGFEAVENTNFSWTTNLTTTAYLSNKLKTLESPLTRIANAGAPGNNATPMILLEEGQPLGQIWGATYQGTDASGNAVFADTSGDNVYNRDDDNTVIGSGIPDLELGWNNTFKMNNWDVNVFMRSVIGHDLVNMYRFFYENAAATSLNRIYTDNFDPSLTSTPNTAISTRVVENADFVKLDNLSVGYTFPSVGQRNLFSNMRVYATGQGLATITGYSGVDPEIRWVDTGATDNGGFQGASDARAPGIDRRNTYVRPFSLSMGINFDIN